MTKLEPKQLDELRDLLNQRAKFAAEAEVINAQLNVKMINYVASAGFSVDVGGVCINCGNIQKNRADPCECQSDCSPNHNQPR